MTLYLIFFSIIAFYALEIPRLKIALQYKLLQGFCLAMWILAASRHEVGGDWDQYLEHFAIINSGPFLQSMTMFEPGWAAINRLSGIFGAGVYGVNAFAAVVGVAGIYLMCRISHKPLLGLVISFPYLYMVVLMGFVRQAIAVGFFAIAIYLFERGRSSVLVLCVCTLGLMFHSTALFPIIFFVAGTMLVTQDGNVSKNRIILFIAIQLVLLYLAITMFSLESKYASYSDYEYNPSASRIRAFYNLCVMALWYRARNVITRGGLRMMGDLAMWVSIGGFLSVWFYPLIFDRLMIYFLPFHILVLANVRVGAATGLLRKSLIFCSGGFLTIWLLFANNANRWIPYQSVLFLH